MSTPTLFKPIQLGGNGVTLKHRVAMAPLTRFRAQESHTHSEMAIEYYKQRASTPGTLIITEATFIAPNAGGYKFVPGIWNPEQIKAWKQIVDAVHARGSVVYMQLWALGRAATGKVLADEPGGPYPVVSSSDIGLTPGGPTRGSTKPKALTETEIQQYIADYAQAAKNFVLGAGGDGVEIHGANGYLIDQFTQNTSNRRTDRYGGSVENRCRFAREVVDAVAKAVGPERTAIRLSPHSDFQEMKMPENELKETFTFLVNALARDQPNLSYLHFTQPRVAGGFSSEAKSGESLDFLLDIWAPRPVVLAGTYTTDSALADAEKYKNAIIAFGRYFISNPDLPIKIKTGTDFTPYNRKTFYLQGPAASEGYTTYGDPAASGQAKL